MPWLKHNPKKAAFYLTLFCSWMAASSYLIHMEFLSLKNLPSYWKLGAFDKKLMTDGPIFILLKIAGEIIPENAAVYFVNPASGAEAAYYEGKLKYYLYPRKLSFSYHKLLEKPAEFQAVDYILLFVPENQAPLYEVLIRQMSFEKIFDYVNSGNYEAIYKNGAPRASPGSSLPRRQAGAQADKMGTHAS